MGTYSWHEDFFNNKVKPQIAQALGDCTGFFPWLEKTNRQTYDEILRLEQEINDIWNAQGDRKKFKAICIEWHDLHIRAMEKFRARMAIKQEPEVKNYEPIQERLI
jgi:hypothetical protein